MPCEPFDKEKTKKDSKTGLMGPGFDGNRM